MKERSENAGASTSPVETMVSDSRYVQLLITLPDEWEGPFDPSHTIQEFVNHYRNPYFEPEKMPMAKFSSTVFYTKYGCMIQGPTLKLKTNLPLAHIPSEFEAHPLFPRHKYRGRFFARRILKRLKAPVETFLAFFQAPSQLPLAVRTRGKSDK